METKKNPTGVYTDSQLFCVMALVYTYIFFDRDPFNSFPLRQAARRLTQQLGEILETLIAPEAKEPIHFKGFIGLFHNKHTVQSEYGRHTIQKLFESGLSTKDIIWSQILPTAGGMIANQAQLFAECLDFYLEEENAEHLKEIKRLANIDDEEADKSLLRYFMEGTRIRTSVGICRDVATPATVNDGDRQVNVSPGEEIFLDCVTACQDPTTFPEPEKFKPDRPMDSYIHYSHGLHHCSGFDISTLASTTMLKTVAKLENLRRAPGAQGRIRRIASPGGVTSYMTADDSRYFPFPTTMKVRWDGDLPAVEA